MGRYQKLDIILENEVIQELMLSRNVSNKKCARKLINENKFEKDTDDF